MQKQALVLTIILNLLSTSVWGEDFLVNYYHKGAIVHQQQVAEGSAIGALPQLVLNSCNNNIAYFAGWIKEDDANNYLVANNTTPTFINEEFVPTSNINLYALFADSQEKSAETWTIVTKSSELTNGDKIILASADKNHAMSSYMNADNNKFLCTNITKSTDKSVLFPNDSTLVLTIGTNNNFFTLSTGTEYLCNKLTTNYTISKTASLDEYCNWSFIFAANKAYIQSKSPNNTKYLFYNTTFFACTTTQTYNISVYKKSTSATNYIICTEPDAVEYTISLHDGNTIHNINCMSNASIIESDLPQPTLESEYIHFAGWTTQPISPTSTSPEIVTFPFNPTGNIDLYALYYYSTDESLTLTDKCAPANWLINETLIHNTKIAIFKDNYIEIPYTENIKQIDVEMQRYALKSNNKQYLKIETDDDAISYLSPETTNSLKTYSFTLNSAFSTSLKFYTFSTRTDEGVLINSITIHHEKIFTTSPVNEQFVTITFDANGGNNTYKTYSLKQKIGGEIVLPNNMFSHNDQEFLNWNSQPDGSGYDFEPGEMVKELTDNMTLYAQWGEKLELDANTSTNIESQSEIAKLIINIDNNGNSGEIAIAENMELNVTHDITINKTIDGLRYHFFSLPFDCKIADIQARNQRDNSLLTYADANSGDWVICRYDQTLAANNAGDVNTNAWIEILDINATLKANQGYIIGHFCNEMDLVTVTFKSAKNQVISSPKEMTFDLGNNYQWFSVGEKISACGWNLIGSPYYETITQGTLTTFVTIPDSNGKTYTQCLYSDALANNLISPFSAFFIQLKENVPPTIIPDMPNFALLNEANSQTTTIAITNSTLNSNRTSIIDNANCSAEYEIGSDLTKWIGYADQPQIYTIENETPLAFNSQKITDSTILQLGIYAPTEDEYTITTECSRDVYLHDKLTNDFTKINNKEYTIYLSQGTYNDRFNICFTKTTSNSTSIAEIVSHYVKNGTLVIENLPQNSLVYIYDSTGKLISCSFDNRYTLPLRGVYHIIITNCNKNINNFSIIY